VIAIHWNGPQRGADPVQEIHLPRTDWSSRVVGDVAAIRLLYGRDELECQSGRGDDPGENDRRCDHVRARALGDDETMAVAIMTMVIPLKKRVGRSTGGTNCS